MKSRFLAYQILWMIIIFSALEVSASPVLPGLFADHMVLQRDRPIHIWGKADKGERITIQLANNKITTRASKTGQWSVFLPAMTAGGPYTLTVSGKKEKQTINDILIGDVWVCSGQSNMEWILRNSNQAAIDIPRSENPFIRLFTVEKDQSFVPKEELKGGTWSVCNANTSPDFSAVGYYFGQYLQQDLHIPIGLIHTSWGGTNIQTWISWDSMQQNPAYQHVDLKQMEADRSEMQKKAEAFRASLKADAGTTGHWYDPATSTADWKSINLPQLWEQTEIGNADGVVWFRKTFTLDEVPAGEKCLLSLGPIDDEDITWINGRQVGSYASWNTDRNYDIPAGILKQGENVLVVKVTDNGGGGGIYGKPDQLFLQAGSRKINLGGLWQYKAAVLNTHFGIQDTGPNSFPSQLFNAMIAPLIPFPIKGAIWYQGESNAYQAYAYRTLFPTMINDWRHRWGYDFPFLWVQLANFMAPKNDPSESEWAELREAQNMTLDLPATGQAVIIDIGEAGDIHPRNKKDVGYRLSLAALHTAYGRSLVYSGPVYQSAEVRNNEMRLHFTNTGSGLLAKGKYGYLKGFAIAGSDKKFVWAQARIEGDQIIVHSPLVQHPVAVRYAWADNPDDANLYNREGLPASPFRTDTWPGQTVSQK